MCEEYVTVAVCQFTQWCLYMNVYASMFFSVCLASGKEIRWGVASSRLNLPSLLLLKMPGLLGPWP